MYRSVQLHPVYNFIIVTYKMCPSSMSTVHARNAPSLHRKFPFPALLRDTFLRYPRQVV